MRTIKTNGEKNKKRDANGILSEEPTREQKEWVRRKMSNFYLESSFCDVCGHLHNPIDLRTYEDVEFFNTVQELLDRYTENKCVKKIKVTI